MRKFLLPLIAMCGLMFMSIPAQAVEVPFVGAPVYMIDSIHKVTPCLSCTVSELKGSDVVAIGGGSSNYNLMTSYAASHGVSCPNGEHGHYDGLGLTDTGVLAAFEVGWRSNITAT